MKKLGYIGLALLLSLSVGCGKKGEEAVAPVASTAPEIETQEEVDKFTAEDFRDFFKKYFSLTEEQILSLNKNYQTINSEYWTNLESYKKTITAVIGSYLAEDVKEKLDDHYLNSEIQLPKKMMINEYVTYGNAQIENLEISSTRPMGENMIYEIAVTTYNEVQSINDFLKNYTWVEDSAYYALKAGEGNVEQLGLTEDLVSSVTNGSDYMYASGASSDVKDVIKLVQKYWVEVEPGDKLRIKSIQEADKLMVDENVRMKVTNTQHVTRIPYYNEASEKEKGIIEKVFIQLMGGSKAFYTYYDKAVETSYTSYKELWKEIGLLNDIILDEKTYSRTFADTINPYKDNIIQLTLTPQTIQITPSIYSTKMQPRFIVSMPIKALLSNNEIVYYNYKYFVGMDSGKIEFIEFMNMESLTEEDYNASIASEGTPAEGSGQVDATQMAAETEEVTEQAALE